MKKNKIPVFILLIVLLGGILTFQSCRKDFTFENEFEEARNISTNMYIDGSVAVPILNTEFTIGDFIPELDSSFYVTIDETTDPNDPYYELIHLKMDFHNIASIKASQIYDGLPAPFNTVIPAGTFVMNTDTSKMKLYDKALSGHLYFFNPKITFKFHNNIPLASYFRLDTLAFHYIRNQAIDSLIFTADMDQTHTLNKPTVEGTPATTEILFDKNVYDGFEGAFSPIPKFVSFCISVGSQTDQTLPWAVTGDEKISMDAFVDLPMEARLEDFALGDTIDFSFADSNNYEQIKAVTIKLMFDNFIPAGGVFTIAFADTNQAGLIDDTHHRIENGDDNQPLEFLTAITDGGGVPTSSVKSQFTIHLTQEHVQTIITNNCTKILLIGNFNSYQSGSGQYVKIFSWCTLGVKLGVKIDYAGDTGDI